MLKVHIPTNFKKTFVIISVPVMWNIYALKHKHTHNASLWVPLATVAERGCQRGGAALIVQCGASIIDGWVDGDCPHARGITITVAVVIATTVSWCPHVDAAFSSPPLKHHHHHEVKWKYVIILLITNETYMDEMIIRIWEFHLTVTIQWVSVCAILLIMHIIQLIM